MLTTLFSLKRTKRDSPLKMPNPSDILKKRTQKAIDERRKKQRRKQKRREAFKNSYLEKIKSRNFTEMNAQDIVAFYRSYYEYHEGYKPLQESYGKCLKIAKNLLDNYGGPKTMDIMVASFESNYVPRSFQYFANAQAVNSILDPSVFKVLKKDASLKVKKWLEEQENE